MAKTNFLEHALLDHTLRAASGGSAYIRPAHIYLALFKASPGETGATVDEVVGGAYARQEVFFGAPSNGSVANLNQILFPKATLTWGTVTHLGYFDAISGGNLLYYGTMGTSKPVLVDDIASFPVGSLVLSED